MKNKIFFISLFFLSFLLLSCESEDKYNLKEQNKAEQLSTSVNASKEGDTFTFMTYSSMQELQDKLPRAISLMLDDAQDIIAQDTRVTDAFINIKFSSGKAYLSEIVFYDSNKDEIIRGNILNFDNMTYYPITNSTFPILWSGLVGNCPTGYSSVGTCNTLEGAEALKACVTSKVAAYMSASLSDIGDCANVQVSIGTFTTRVCGKKC